MDINQPTPPTQETIAKVAKFSDDEKSQLAMELERERDDAQSLATTLRQRDTGFKIFLFLLTLSTAVLSAIIALYTEEAPLKLRITNAVIAAASAAFTAFIDKFGLAGRRQIFQRKAFALRALIDQLRFGDPEKHSFLERKATVVGWTDQNPPNENFNLFGR